MAENASQVESELDVATVMAGLDGPWNVLPEETLRTIQRRRDEFIPALIQAIRDATAKIRAGEAVAGSRHFYALFLLTEFRAKEALPAIMEAISLPDRRAYEIYFDGMDAPLASMFAVLAGDQPELIDAFIRDSSVDEHTRWEAINSIAYLVRDGVIPREVAGARLVALLRHAVDSNDSVIVEALVITLGAIGAAETRHVAREAITSERHVFQGTTDWESVEQDFDAAERGDFSALDLLDPTELGDTVEYLRDWYCYRPDEDEVRPLSPVENLLSDWPIDAEMDDRKTAYYDAVLARLEERSAARFGDDRPEPIQAEVKVGRNDPCPCGSGKKYKKCCGGRS